LRGLKGQRRNGGILESADIGVRPPRIDKGKTAKRIPKPSHTKIPGIFHANWSMLEDYRRRGSSVKE